MLLGFDRTMYSSIFKFISTGSVCLDPLSKLYSEKCVAVVMLGGIFEVEEMI